MVVFLILLLYVGSFWNVIYGQCNFDPSCWQCRAGYKLAAFPFERTAPVSCQECMDNCARRLNGPGPYCCQSAVYDPYHQTCDLFAVACNTQTLVPCPGMVYFEPTRNPICPYGRKTTPLVTQAPTPAPDCPAGQSPIMVGFKNSMSNLINGGTTIPANSQDDCMQYCRKNQDNKGNIIQCKTAQFSSGQCTISSNPPVPNSPSTLQPTLGVYYYEKQCLPTGSFGNCNSIVMDPKHLLVGQNVKTIDAATYSDCLQACFNAQEFKCSSGSFYTDSTTMNCILNSESTTTKPDAYTATQDPVVYFEPSCTGSPSLLSAVFLRMKQSDVPVDSDSSAITGKWTQWTECDPNLNQRVRYKNCKEVRITSCPSETETCHV